MSMSVGDPLDGRLPYDTRAGFGQVATSRCKRTLDGDWHDMVGVIPKAVT